MEIVVVKLLLEEATCVDETIRLGTTKKRTAVETASIALSRRSARRNLLPARAARVLSLRHYHERGSEQYFRCQVISDRRGRPARQRDIERSPAQQAQRISVTLNDDVVPDTRYFRARDVR